MKPALTPEELEARLALAYANPASAEAILDAAGIIFDRVGLRLACASYEKKREKKRTSPLTGT